MVANQPQRVHETRQAILTDDGELRDVPDSQPDSGIMYCTQCGTASRSDARFCRTCGHSLDAQAAQVVYTPPEQKLKRADLRVVERRSAPMTFFSLVFNLIKLGIVLGAVSTLYLKTNNVVMPIIILVAWVCVEIAQAESAKH
jgi:hypothetical protein